MYSSKTQPTQVLAKEDRQNQYQIGDIGFNNWLLNKQKISKL